MKVINTKTKKSNYFYSPEEINYIKEKLEAGERTVNIAKVFVTKYDRNRASVVNKINGIKKSINLVTPRKNSPVAKQPAAVITLPEGFTFSGKCKKVEISDTFFKVYF